MAIEFTVEGLDEIIAKLETLENSKQYLDATLKGIGDEIQKEAGKYPPALPIVPGKSYWKRMEGSRYYRLDGSFSRGQARSENLAGSWKVEPGDKEVTIRNAASYAAYVHGEWQPSFHAAHGWRKLKETAEAMMPELMERVRKTIDRIIGNK